MSKRKLRIKAKRPWIAYPGSTVQQNYGEALSHGYLLWKVHSKNSYDVDFFELPNPKPYVTLPWEGLENTLKAAHVFPRGSRFRIASDEQIPQKDAVILWTKLTRELYATEVVHKTNKSKIRDAVTSAASILARDNLRSVDVIIKLLKDYHDAKIEDDVMDRVKQLVTSYMTLIGSNEEVPRNTKWNVRGIKFDNTFTYGEKNSINFDSLSGITGIFAPNRFGKSSLVGTLAYALFNTTDRGPIKNAYIVNSRKPYCLTQALVDVNGTEYLIERQTVKQENKKGQVNASTALNVFRIDEVGEAHDLVGEERKDTERVIRKLIGSPEDFFLTSCAAQDDLKLFINQGSTKRNQILARYLDLDVFSRMFEMAKNEMNEVKAQLKSIPEHDVTAFASLEAKMTEVNAKVTDCDARLHEVRDKLDQAKRQLESHQDHTPVTKSQVEDHRRRVSQLEQQAESTGRAIEELKKELSEQEEKIASIEKVTSEYSLDELKKRLEAYRSLEAGLLTAKHNHEKEAATLKQQERSLKILDDVPCGDQFPDCKFIKDAHQSKSKIEGQRAKLQKAAERLQKASDALDVLKAENITSKVEKLEKLHVMHGKLLSTSSTRRVELVKKETTYESLLQVLESSRTRLVELEEALKNDENAEVVSLRSEVDEYLRMLKKLDNERLEAATELGGIQTKIEKFKLDKEKRDSVLEKLRPYELIVSAFSKRGIPATIVRSQLPLINAEIAEILQGIVDFTIELETDEESEQADVYINYGDRRSIIELCSGMEKTIASIAIRVALINVSSLPKTDMFILDEGFGVFDAGGVEACNRLLVSLKRFFKNVLVITHVDAVKDIADQVIEITKNEKDSCVVQL